MQNYCTGLFKVPRFAHFSLLLLFPTVRFASWSGPTCPDEVSFMGFGTLLAPSPCTWLSHAPSTMSQSDSLSPSVRLPLRLVRTYLQTSFRVRLRPFFNLPNSVHRSYKGLPSSRTFLFLHARLSDPDRPSGISPLRFLCVGFRCVDRVAVCIFAIYEAELLQGSAIPLWLTRFSVYASFLLFTCAPDSYRNAPLLQKRNTRYGWVVSPCPTRTSSLPCGNSVTQ